MMYSRLSGLRHVCKPMFPLLHVTLCADNFGNNSRHMYLQEHGIPVLVYILNRPQDWDVALKLEGITAIMTDSPSALSKYLSDRK